ncbi:MAG: cell division topological specificity factor MinE [Andreesenia angusta]|nr:cell division topological specificity factor MinE [Andreesenia angusta]
MEIFKIFGRNKKSKNVAKERLKLVLVQDRNKVSPILLENMKADIIEAISKYAEVDFEAVELEVNRTKKDMESAPITQVVANIPIKKIKKNIEE